MTNLRPWRLRGAAWITIAALLAAVSGCGSAPPAQVAAADLRFDAAVNAAADNLLAQARARSPMLQISGKLARHGLVQDPALEARTGQQTTMTLRMDELVRARIASGAPEFELLPFGEATLPKAQYLLTSTATRVDAAAGAPASSARWRINLSLVDLRSGVVLAQSSATATDEGVDTSPTAFYRDSPVLVRDGAIKGYIATSETAAGQPADKTYLSGVGTAAKLQEATDAYNKAQYADALKQYQAAQSMAAGKQVRTYDGIYLSSTRLDRQADAEAAFGKLVAAGVADKSLSVKLLFNPGGTTFWSDPQISGPYPMWLRQVAAVASSASICMDLVGHTSLTGSAAFNDKLSQQRAGVVKERLEGVTPALRGRLAAHGKGSAEPLVGTGTDDARDALDRRVEFKIVDCPAG
jgi:outer membrane protein OmpA-like peptidoglycan-associated protein